MKRILSVLAVVMVGLLVAPTALAGGGPVGPSECPDHDGDGICNGHDPDYVPGEECPNLQCPNPDCPDADGDGICNGQDPDYTPPGDGPKRNGRTIGHRLLRLAAALGLGGLAI